jgi:hypothetical protein
MQCHCCLHDLIVYSPVARHCITHPTSSLQPLNSLSSAFPLFLSPYFSPSLSLSLSLSPLSLSLSLSLTHSRVSWFVFLSFPASPTTPPSPSPSFRQRDCQVAHIPNLHALSPRRAIPTRLGSGGGERHSSDGSAPRKGSVSFTRQDPQEGHGRAYALLLGLDALALPSEFVDGLPVEARRR